VTEPVAPGQVRPFADILRDLGRGEVADEAAVMLTELVQTVRACGKKGNFTLRVEVAPFKGDTRQLMVSAVAESKPPKGDPIAAIFFADDSGNLVRNDPHQPMLPLRDVARADAELRGTK
jgi:hypothetical protein